MALCTRHDSGRGIEVQLATSLTILTSCTQAVLEGENVRYAGYSSLRLCAVATHTNTYIHTYMHTASSHASSVRCSLNYCVSEQHRWFANVHAKRMYGGLATLLTQTNLLCSIEIKQQTEVWTNCRLQLKQPTNSHACTCSTTSKQTHCNLGGLPPFSLC